MKLQSLLYTTALVSSTNALFDCNDDQHAFSANPDKFVVHFTSSRDSNYNGNEPWIRICLPKKDGSWENVEPLALPCDSPSNVLKFPTSKTNLKAELTVGLGNACDSHTASIRGTYYKYKTVEVHLDQNYSNGHVCGDRNHGVSCQMDF